MTTQIQRRRGTTAQHSTFTGAVGEVTVDTDKEVLVVHDGAQVGGYPQMRENGSNSALALGSAGTPSLKFTGDTNTGIYSPGADQVAISTGGSQRFTVDSNGNVSVGSYAASDAALTLSRSGNSYLFLHDSTSSALDSAIGNVGGNIVFRNGANVGVVADLTERVRIDTSGRVGIGTSPGELLHVYNSAATSRLIVGPSGTGAATPNALALEQENTGYTVCHVRNLYNNAGLGELRLGGYGFTTFTSGSSQTERLRITSAGLVGVGASSAPGGFDSRMWIDQAGTNDCGLLINASGGVKQPTLWLRDASATLSGKIVGQGGLTLATSSSATAAITIDMSQRVGIGTTSPGSALSVTSSANTAWFTFRGTTSGFDYGTFTNSAAQVLGYLGAGNSAITTALATDLALRAETNLVFASNGNTERARIDSSGRLLVGTSSSVESNALLQVVKASGTNVIQASSSLGNGESCRVVTLANSRAGVIGVYKHSGITNACAYLALTEEDSADAYYWTDNSGNFRVSNDGNNIGTTNGTVVGTQTSDERIKNILGPVEYALETIKQIEPVRYSLKSEPNVEKLGFVAQQVQPLIPQSVFDTKERVEGEPEDAPTKLGMEYVALIPVLVNAIKELSAEVDTLKAQIS